MDALTFLRADHESVLGLLEQLEHPASDSEASRAARKDLATTLVIAESQHEAVEEQLFWPAVRKMLDNGDELADRAIEQEQKAKKLLKLVEEKEAGSVEFEQSLATVVNDAREHIEYEENVVWPALRESGEHDAELEKLGEAMAKAKKMAPTRPHPGTPPNPAVLGTVGMAAAAVDKVRDAASGRKHSAPPSNPPD